MRPHRLPLGIFMLAIAVCKALATTAIEFAASAIRVDYSDHRASLKSDAIRRSFTELIADGVTAFKAFVTRALNHDEYSGGRFTDGRCPGAT